jgi:hypothetical protein
MTEFVLCADFNIHCFHYSLNYNFCLFCELRAAKIFISQPEDQHGCTRSLFNKNIVPCFMQKCYFLEPCLATYVLKQCDKNGVFVCAFLEQSGFTQCCGLPDYRVKLDVPVPPEAGDTLDGPALVPVPPLVDSALGGPSGIREATSLLNLSDSSR